jgi:hypothetical protein
MPRGDPQLNVRLRSEHRAVLDAAAYVRGTTAARLVQELAEQAITGYERESTVQKALAARREQAAIDDGKVTKLDRMVPRAAS